ncbi:hypothetical protein BU23DRAFT_663742 [Bimuria novae-zelandiae CBS 107.79]|uniref:Uncharacterized protein n=1 Tax=Bimuria novae-zelandiae CBS 107.79 TaxID=1447943 RepID=A0A6A5UMJ0_9PLEO|nr:hypothetical protein BU23DRAFT_663742 [Bimuria novae-zelandiae CBS 107.79]
MCVVLVVNLSHGGVDTSWGTASNTILKVGGGSGNTLLVAWIANSPQIMLSFCYFAMNSECTSMVSNPSHWAGAYEWNNMASSHKGLRVTKPFQEQRSTYFLQLPLRLSLPLMTMSGGLHWLLSQSIFLVQVDSYDRVGHRKESDSVSGCGISGLSFVILCVTFYIFVFVVGFVGRKHLTLQIPFAASCSLVISAACHAPSTEKNTHLKQVQWGVVEERMFDGERHCSFFSGPVTKPQDGVRYR